MTTTLVVAMGANGVIGAHGGMPWHLPEDLAHFKRVTLGHPMVMGRTTYDSIGRPLPGRTTVVVTRQPRWRADGVLVAGSVSDALAMAQEMDDEVFVVGGAQVYGAVLADGLVDRMVVTHVDAAPDGDTRFPDLDWDDWREVTREHHAGAPSFDVVTYERRDPQ